MLSIIMIIHMVIEIDISKKSVMIGKLNVINQIFLN